MFFTIASLNIADKELGPALLIANTVKVGSYWALQNIDRYIDE